MTLYDLHCDACNATFEAWQDRDAKGPFRCQKCGKRRARRSIVAPAYHDRYSPMHPRKGRGNGGRGRVG